MANKFAEPPELSWRNMLFATIVFFVGVLTEAGLIVGMKSAGLSPVPEGHSDFGLRVVALIMLCIAVMQDRSGSSQRRLKWLLAAIPVAFAGVIVAMLPGTLLADWHDSGQTGDVFLGLVSGVGSIFAMALVLFLILRLMGPPDWAQDRSDGGEEKARRFGFRAH